MSSLYWGIGLVFLGGLTACDNPEEKTQDTMEDQDTGQSSAYGTCSLEMVSASRFSFSALTVGAATAEIQLVFVDEEHGEQVEEHPLQLEEEGQSSLSWLLELEQASEPIDVVLGQSTLWTASVFDPVDQVFVARDENNQVCDCWNVSTEYGQINCEMYETD